MKSLQKSKRNEILEGKKTNKPEPVQDLRRVGRNLTVRCADSWRISSPECRAGMKVGSIRHRPMVGWLRRLGRFHLRRLPRRHRLDYPPITRFHRKTPLLMYLQKHVMFPHLHSPCRFILIFCVTSNDYSKKKEIQCAVERLLGNKKWNYFLQSTGKSPPSNMQFMFPFWVVPSL